MKKIKQLLEDAINNKSKLDSITKKLVSGFKKYGYDSDQSEMEGHSASEQYFKVDIENYIKKEKLTKEDIDYIHNLYSQTVSMLY